MKTNRGCRFFRVVVTEVKEAASTFTVTLRRLELRMYLIQFTFYMFVGDQIKMLLSFLTAEVAQVLQWTLPSWELHNCDALHLEPVVNPAQKLTLLQGWIWHMLSVALQEYCLCAPGQVASKRSFKSFLLLLYRISNDPGLPILDRLISPHSISAIRKGELALFWCNSEGALGTSEGISPFDLK